MAATEASTAEFCTAFSARLAVSETSQRSRPVVALEKEGALKAKLRIGVASATLEVCLDGEERPAVKQVNMIPTARLDASRIGKGVLRVTDTWPTSSLCLKFSSELEARKVQEELEAVATELVQSLHLRAPPGAPLLTLRPLPGAGPLNRSPAERGRFHMGGYALWDDLSVNREPRGSPRRFRLYWVELCGPLFGMTALYFYSDHRKEGKLMNYTVLNRGGFSLAGSQLRIHGQEPAGGVMYAYEAEILRTDESLTFRSAEEAQLWFDVSTAVLDPDCQGHEDSAAHFGGRLEEVVSELQRQASKAQSSTVPLLADASYSLAPKPEGPLPTDDVAMDARSRQDGRMHALADDFNFDEDPSEEAAYESFGTTVFNN